MQQPWVRGLVETSIVGAKNRHSFGYEYVLGGHRLAEEGVRASPNSISTSTVEVERDSFLRGERRGERWKAGCVENTVQSNNNDSPNPNQNNNYPHCAFCQNLTADTLPGLGR
jgi:hypothetical protein